MTMFVHFFCLCAVVYQAIVLGSKGCDIKFQCANETIPTSNEFKLLGVMLDSKLKFDAHVASVCRKVGGR